MSAPEHVCSQPKHLHGSYSPGQWCKLSAEDKKLVVEGCAKSAEQQQQAGQKGSCISALITADQDVQYAFTLPTAIADANAVSTSSQIGDKRSNPDIAGSHMSRRRINRIATGPRHKTEVQT